MVSRRSRHEPIIPSAADVLAAHRVYEEREPRNLFYRVATELMAATLDRGESTTISVPEALAVLLQTWNVSFYRFRGGFSQSHFSELDALWHRERENVLALRPRTLISYEHARDGQSVRCVVHAFYEVLWPVGAAKALHLLCPLFFPIWDRKIANAYGLAAQHMGDDYFVFMHITCRQLASIGGEALGTNPLKALDEWNYCRFTLSSEQLS